MSSEAEPQFYTATEAFSAKVLVDGVPTQVTVGRGENVAAGHELVRNHPQFFTPIEVTTRFATVEQATAGPGERRNVGRKPTTRRTEAT